MQGNSLGIYGGFSSSIPVPAIDLCEVRTRGYLPLSHLAVIADAVTTPFRACKRANLQAGDKIIVVGCEASSVISEEGMRTNDGCGERIDWEIMGYWHELGIPEGFVQRFRLRQGDSLKIAFESVVNYGEEKPV